ncbi:hypothetical protein ABT186_23155 [Streptomyces sp. NPDC001634]|uniref:hypothetical protein n=1 Tax=Streptomyces sp. NPDC001634 TaxID=3154390 RepID=UPI003327CB38
MAVCLEPPFDNPYEALMEQLGEDPDIFRIPGDATGPVGFGESWLRAVRELPCAARAVGSRTDNDLKNP